MELAAAADARRSRHRVGSPQLSSPLRTALRTERDFFGQVDADSYRRRAPHAVRLANMPSPGAETCAKSPLDALQGSCSADNMSTARRRRDLRIQPIVLLLAGCGGDGCEPPLPTNGDVCRPPTPSTGGGATAGLVDSDPEFENFLADNALPAHGGGWTLEGDLYFSSTQELYEFYRMNVRAEPAEPKVTANDAAGVQFRSTVGCGDGLYDDIWNVGARQRITYCIGPFSDEELRSEVLAGLPNAIGQLERAAGVNFVELKFPPLDPSPEQCEQEWFANNVAYIVREARTCPAEDDPTTD